MLRLGCLFMILALVAGLFGYGLVGHAFADLARVCFFVFVVLFVVALLFDVGDPNRRDRYFP